MTFSAVPAEFNSRAANDKTADEPTSPFSIRLNRKQRANLKRDAKGKPLGVHMRSLMFEDDGSLRPRKSRSVGDAEALARVLGMLGSSELPKNFNKMTKLAHCGALPVTPETCAELSRACREISEMRSLILKALDVRKAGL